MTAISPASKTPVCRICRSSKWVAIYREDDLAVTICMECCPSADHADGETGHQWSVIGEGCDYCGLSRHDAGPDAWPEPEDQ